MTTVRMATRLIGVASLVAVTLLGSAAAEEKLVGTYGEVRTVLAFKAPPAAVQRLLPEDWEPAPIAAGPSRGCQSERRIRRLDYRHEPRRQTWEHGASRIDRRASAQERNAGSGPDGRRRAGFRQFRARAIRYLGTGQGDGGPARANRRLGHMRLLKRLGNTSATAGTRSNCSSDIPAALLSAAR